MSLERKIGFFMLVMGLILIIESVILYTNCSGGGFCILIPSTLKTWKYFWE